MLDKTETYTYCPKCGEKKKFTPNATYLCHNCGLRFYVKINNTKSYVSDYQEPIQLAYIQKIVDVFLKIIKSHNIIFIIILTTIFYALVYIFLDYIAFDLLY